MKLELPLQIPVEPSDAPSDFKMLTTTALQPVYVEPLRFMLTCWPDVPLNVKRAICPATFVVTVSGVPTEMGPVTSLNVVTCTATLPVDPLDGRTARVYVPVTARFTLIKLGEEHEAEDPTGVASGA